MSLFNSLKIPQFKKVSTLGVDIGTASIKIVESVADGEIVTLKNYGILESHGHLDRLNNAIQTSSLKIVGKQTSDLLKKLIDEMSPSAKTVVASIPAYAAFTTLIEIPMMSKEETAQTMTYQAKAFVPSPLTEVAIDWLPVKEFTDKDGVKKQQVFLVSISNKLIETYKNIFRLAGLTLEFIEVETLSLARLLTTGDPTISLIVDIGARSTAIAVAGGGSLRYNAQTDYAASSLTQAIARGYGVDMRRAEDLKRQKGLIGTGGQYQVSTLMLPYLDVILNEVKRVRSLFERSYKEKVERVIISGGGANLLGIEKYVSDQIGIPAIKANPFGKIAHPPGFEPLASNLGAPLSVALGLATRKSN